MAYQGENVVINFKSKLKDAAKIKYSKKKTIGYKRRKVLVNKTEGNK